MRSLHLDFLHPHPRPPWAAWALLAGGILLAGLAMWRHGELAGEIAREQGIALRLQADTQSPATRPRQAGASGQTAQTTVQARLELPWAHLFRSLEQLRSKHIALISLEADDRRNEATLTAEARTPEAMLAYLEDLKVRAGLQAVVLSSHEVQEEDEQRPLRFVIRLGWRG